MEMKMEIVPLAVVICSSVLTLCVLLQLHCKPANTSDTPDRFRCLPFLWASCW